MPPVRNLSFVYSNATECEVLRNSSKSDFLNWDVSWPWLCSGVSYGDRTWRGLACYPFWEYGAAEMVVAFVFLLGLRGCSRHWYTTWTRERQQRELERQLQLSRQADAEAGNDSLRHPLMAADTELRFSYLPTMMAEEAPVSRLFGAQDSVVSDIGGSPPPVENTSNRVSQHVLHGLLQVFQWWALMLVFLVALLVWELDVIDRKYKIWDTVFHPLLTNTPRTKPAAFAQIPDWLCWFAIYSIPVLIFIYVVCISCIVAQVAFHIVEMTFSVVRKKASGQICAANGSFILSMPRDVAIQVLLLPMVYGFLSFRSVGTMWSSMSGLYPTPLTCPRWDAQKNTLVESNDSYIKATLMEVYESNFALADLYEAWSLFKFAEMVARVLEPELKKKIKPEVFKAFEGLLVIDVAVFVVIELISAGIRIGLTWAKWRRGVDLCEVAPALCVLSPYLLGANWCVSSVAIYNLLVIEFRFHGLDNMRKFWPRMKFWAIKLMVLVSFWTELLLSPLGIYLHLTPTEAKILDSSFRIYVMAIVAIMNIIGWWPYSSWYRTVINEKKKHFAEKEHAETHLTDVGNPNDVPSGTVSLVRELFSSEQVELTQEEAQSFSRIEKRIRAMTRDELSRVLYLGSQIGWVVPSKFSNLHNRGPIKVVGLFSNPKTVEDSECRKALFLRGVEEQRHALIGHLRGFYPDGV